MSGAPEIARLRKGGQLVAALEHARACHAAKPGDSYIQHAYGWVLYSIVKSAVEELDRQQATAKRFAERMPLWLAEYQTLGAVERPGMLHSCMLTQAVNSHRAWAGFLKFAKWWAPSTFRPMTGSPSPCQTASRRRGWR